VIRYWVPAVAWSAVLLWMSGGAGSPGLTARILEWIVPAASPQFEPLHFLVRKGGHILAYGLLGALDFRAVRGARSGWSLRWSIAAVALATMIAVLDEWHQSIVPTRTGTPGDVIIDCAGALLAQVFYVRFS
jgi:VanZ family protein